MSVNCSPLEFPEKLVDGDHLVQFYRSKYFLAEKVANFIVPALMSGEAAVIVATENHLELFKIAMQQLHVEVDALVSSGQLIMLEGESTLSKLIVNNKPDVDRFNEIIVQPMMKLKEKYPSIKVYGELVNMLWGEGNKSASIELEKIWCSFLNSKNFTLLCAYSIDSLSEDKHGEYFHEVCRHHTHVIPAEGVIDYDDPNTQLKNIAALQFHTSVKEKELKNWKTSSLEMMIPLTAIKIQLADMKKTHKNDPNLSCFMANCEDQLTAMKKIVEKLSL